jgi:hypothetical protein
MRGVSGRILEMCVANFLKAHGDRSDRGDRINSPFFSCGQLLDAVEFAPCFRRQ